MLKTFARASDPARTRFNVAVKRSTEDKRAHEVKNLVIFACALEHISAGHSIPEAWNWDEKRYQYWNDYVSLFRNDAIWNTIRVFKEKIQQPNGRVKRLGDLIWALARQGANPTMKAWDRVFERFIVARLIDPRSITRSSPLFHRVGTMATEASQLTWIMRAAAVLQIKNAKDAWPQIEAFDYDQLSYLSHSPSIGSHLLLLLRHDATHLAPYLRATTETAFGTLRSMATWLSGVVSNLDQLEADGHFAWVSPEGLDNYKYFTWKQEIVSLDWVKKIPMAAVRHAETQMENFLHWVKPNWEPRDLKERIRVGFCSQDMLEIDQLFFESPNDSDSFLTRPSSGLAPFADTLKRELAAQARLIVIVNGKAQLSPLTRDEFFDHAAKIVKARSTNFLPIRISFVD